MQLGMRTNEGGSGAWAEVQTTKPKLRLPSLTALHSASVATSAILCYYNSLSCGLVFDDVAAVKENKDIRPRSPVSNLFLNDFWGTPIHREESHKSYRPLCALSFRLNFALHGLDPFGYHLVNVLLHSLVSVLFYRLCIIFLPKRVSLIASLLFAVHPIHTEAVTGVVGRAELLSAVCYLSALIFYIERSTRTREPGGVESWVPVMLAIIGTLCKEQCLMVLPLCAIYELTLCIKSWKSKSWNDCKEKRIVFLSSGVRIGILMIGVVIIIIFRFWMMGSKMPVFSRFDNPASVSPLHTRSLTYNFLYALNFWLLLFPSFLCCDWTMGTVPLIKDLNDSRNLGTAAFYIALGSVVSRALWIMYSKHRQQKQCLIITMGLSMMILPFLPASNLFFPVGFVLAERVLYLPSMGFCILVANGYHKLTDNQMRKPFQVQMVFLLLCFSIKTVNRNEDWRSDRSLFASAISINRRNPKLLNNYGKALESFGRHEEALIYYRRSMSLEPKDIRSYLNCGKALSFLGRYAEAEAMFLQAKSLLPNPNDPLPLDLRITTSHLHVFLNLAAVIARNHSRLTEADEILLQSLKIRSDYSNAYYRRGQLMQIMNKTKDAEVMYSRAILDEKSNADLYNNYGLVLLNSGRSNEALSFFTKALDIEPDHQNTLLNLASFLQECRSLSAKKSVLSRLEAGARLGRQNETLYFRLGMIYLEHHDKNLAEKWFRRAIEIQPGFRSALYNLALLLSEEDRPAEALPILEQLLLYHPDHTKGLLLLGDLYVNYDRNLDKAQQCYEKVIELDPGNARGRHNLCVVILEMGQIKEAELCFMEAKNHHPEVEYIRNNLMVIRSLLNSQRTLKLESSETHEVNPTAASTVIQEKMEEEDYQLAQTYSVQ